MKTVDPRLGERLRQIREHRDISQGQLARAIGVSVGTIQHYEQGRTHITTERLEQLSRALQCEPADLLMPPDEPLPRYRRPRFRPFQQYDMNNWGPWEHWVSIGDDD